jgi:hypothetical protein
MARHMNPFAVMLKLAIASPTSYVMYRNCKMVVAKYSLNSHNAQ